MRTVILIFTIFILFASACKTKPAEPKLLKYYLLIDDIEETEAGPVETNAIDTIFCKDDKAAIAKGLEKYYSFVITTETRELGPTPQLPYMSSAKGWAILDAQGENVKNRVDEAFVDSSNQKALEHARYRIENLQVQ